MKNYKRKWRELTDQHREKIAQATTNKPKSVEHRQHLSQALKDYWRTVPHRPGSDSGHTTMKDLMGHDLITYQGEGAVKNNRSQDDDAR